MSPGINDPGTALNSIDYLSELLRLRMLKADETFISDSEQNFIKLRIATFKELLYQINAPLRRYCSADIVVVQKLGQMFLSLKVQKVANPYYHDILKEEAKRLLIDARAAMSNEADLETLSLLAEKLSIKI
jgi:uncharacterized membrane protein